MRSGAASHKGETLIENAEGAGFAESSDGDADEGSGPVGAEALAEVGAEEAPELSVAGTAVALVSEGVPVIVAWLAVVAVVVGKSRAFEAEAVVFGHAAHAAGGLDLDHAVLKADLFEGFAQTALVGRHLLEVVLGFEGQATGKAEQGFAPMV